MIVNPNAKFEPKPKGTRINYSKVYGGRNGDKLETYPKSRIERRRKTKIVKNGQIQTRRLLSAF